MVIFCNNKTFMC